MDAASKAAESSSPRVMPYAIAVAIGGALLLAGKPLGSVTASLVGGLLMSSAALLGNLMALRKGAVFDRGGFVYLKDDPLNFFLAFALWVGGSTWITVVCATELWSRVG